MLLFSSVPLGHFALLTLQFQYLPIIRTDPAIVAPTFNGKLTPIPYCDVYADC
jgi:hypothetical protein